MFESGEQRIFPIEDPRAGRNGRGGKDTASAVTVTSCSRVMQIALLDIGQPTGARSAALNAADGELHAGHRRPTNRSALERDSGTAAVGDAEIAGVGETKREG